MRSEGIFVATEELAAEMDKEADIVNEISAEHAFRLAQEPIEPFHADFLYPSRGTAYVSGLEVDGGAKRHPQPYTGHSVTVGCDK